MKNILLSAIAFIIMNLFSVAPLQAQSFIDIQAGYGFGALNSSLGNYYNVAWTNTTSKIENVNISFGKGFTFTGAYGYRFSDVLGASVQASYLLGTNNTITNTYSEPGNPDMYKGILKYRSRMIRLNPSIECTIKPGKISPFMDFGFIISYGKLIQDVHENSYGTEIVGIRKFSGGLGYGITAGLGCQYGLSDRISLYGRLRSESISYAPSHSEVTKYESDGEDLLSTLSIHDRETEYVNELESDVSATEDENKPAQELKTHYPFGSIHFSIGVRIKL